MMHTLGVSAALVDGALLAGDVRIDGDTVVEVGLPPTPGGRIAAPGMVDLQVNGFAGIDLMTADVDAIRALAVDLARAGVTAFLPTLITAAPHDTSAALDRIQTAFARADVGARSLGVHLEGPYLSPRRRGTHPAEHLRAPDLAEVQAWREQSPIAAITLAPEMPGGLEMVRALARDGVLVSVGHSDATAEQAHAAFDAGARTVTHLFNAMSPFEHRSPGVPGAALARPDVVVQLILDGHHLAAETIRLAWSAAHHRVVLVTDATAAAGCPDGRYELASVHLTVAEGAVRNDEGALAGSALTLPVAVRTAVGLGLPVDDVLRSVTATPAALLRRPDVGVLRPGSRADLTVFSPELILEQTYLGGTPVS